MIKDILYARVGSFTVNLAVNSVPIVGVAGAFNVQAGLKSWFVPKDNPVIESIAISFPCCFSSVNVINEELQARLYFNDTAAVLYPVTELNAGDGYIGIYCENQEIELNTRVEYPAAVIPPNRCRFLGTLTGRMCMINVPAAFDTLTIFLTAYIKVRHTLPLV